MLSVALLSLCGSLAIAAEESDPYTPDIPISDKLDAWYLINTGRAAQTRAWALAEVEAAPADPNAALDLLEALAGDPSRAGRVTVAWLDARLADQPDTAGRRAARAAARALAAWPDGRMLFGFPMPDRGPWCDEALALLDDLPDDDADGLYTAHWWRKNIGGACMVDTSADEAALEALGLGEALRVGRRAWWQLKDGVEPEEVALIAQTAAEEPSRLMGLGFLFNEKATGTALEEARAALRAEVTRLSASARPAELTVAASLLARDKQLEAEADVRQRLAALDPKNQNNVWRVNSLASEEEAAPPRAPDPTTVIEPEARLAALGARPPKGEEWARIQWWRSRTEALISLGRDEEALKSYSHLWKIAWGYEVNVDFARFALAQGARLREAQRAADVAVNGWMRPIDPDYGPNSADARAEANARLAEALAVRGQARALRGQRGRGVQDLRLSLQLDGGDAERLVWLGLLLAEDGVVERAVTVRDLLAQGLALGYSGPLQAEAEAALSTALAQSQTLPVGDTARFVALTRATIAASPAPDRPEKRLLLPDFALQIDGQAAQLSALEGPLVLDLWATWCGPCKQALPHLDGLARRYEGRVRFLAVSVDEDQAEATAYLDGQGAHAFTRAWGGPELMKALGVHAIPTVLIIDPQGQIASRDSGYNGGSTELEEAIEALLAEAGQP